MCDGEIRLSGFDLDDMLIERGVYAELPEMGGVTFAVSMGNERAHIQLLLKALHEAAAEGRGEGGGEGGGGGPGACCPGEGGEPDARLTGRRRRRVHATGGLLQRARRGTHMSNTSHAPHPQPLDLHP